MSKDLDCKCLADFKQRIAAGEPPEDVIPYCVSIKSDEQIKEFLFYAKQVLKDPHRIKLCEELLEKLNHESR